MCSKCYSTHTHTAESSSQMLLLYSRGFTHMSFELGAQLLTSHTQSNTSGSAYPTLCFLWNCDVQKSSSTPQFFIFSYNWSRLSCHLLKCFWNLLKDFKKSTDFGWLLLHLWTENYRTLHGSAFLSAVYSFLKPHLFIYFCPSLFCFYYHPNIKLSQSVTRRA